MLELLYILPADIFDWEPVTLEVAWILTHDCLPQFLRARRFGKPEPFCQRHRMLGTLVPEPVYFILR